MKMKRNIVTPYLVFLFLILGTSGFLMFFHILDDYTNPVHEFLGLAFILFSILHIIINWTSLKSHFKKKRFIFAGIIVLMISTTLIIIGKLHDTTEDIILNRLRNSPISNSFSVLSGDYNKAEIILRNNNIIIGDSKTIEEISKMNQKSPEEIIKLIIQ